MADDYKQPDPNDINYTTNTYDSSNDNEDNSNEEVEENKEPLVEVKEEFIKPKKNILHKIRQKVPPLQKEPSIYPK